MNQARKLGKNQKT